MPVNGSGFQTETLPGALVALSGCNGPIVTRIDGDLDAPTFHFSQNGGQEPCITAVYIGDAAHHTMWERDHMESCVHLSYLRYGNSPDNFGPAMLAHPLSPNVQYSIAIQGPGPELPGGLCRFAWRAGRWTTSGPDCDQP